MKVPSVVSRLVRHPLPVAQELVRRWRDTALPRTPREFARRMGVIALPALLAPTVVFLVGPHTVYAGNPGEFGVSFAAIAVSKLLLLTAAGWALLLAVGCIAALLSQRTTRLYAALVFTVGVLAWAQGNLLVGDYGLLTGEELDLGAQAWREPYELVLWGGALVLCLIFARPVAAVAPLASALLVGLQALLLAGSMLFSAPESAEAARLDGRAWRLPPDEIYQLSRDRNVIHIVLDGFLSEIFGAFLEKERATFDRDFSGFVFFADHLGAFPSTRASMPAMLSGLAYRNQMPFLDFQTQAIDDKAIYGVLARHGYQVHTVTFHHREHPPASLPGAEIVRYSVPTPYESYEGYVGFAAAQLVDVSLFRHVPHGLKGTIYNGDHWFLQNRYSAREAARRARPSNHAAFFDEFTRRIALADDRPVYTFLHVAIPHPPLVMAADCSFIGQRRTRRSAYAAQARCGIALVQRLLNRLRALGAYDRSVIVLTADHGWRVPGPRHPLRGVTSPAGNLEPVVLGAMPLLAVKPAGSSGPVRTSYAPTAITDIPATIVDLVGVPNPYFPGESVFALDESAVRPRTFAHHSWSNAGWGLPYFDVLRIFSVEGRVLDPKAWKFQTAIFEPSDDLAAQLERYQSGLSGVAQGDDGPFRWGNPQVITYAPPDARTLVLEVRKAPKAPRQTLAIRIDGEERARHVLADDAWHALTEALPPHAHGRNPYCIELLVNPPMRGADRRVRGAMYRTVKWSR